MQACFFGELFMLFHRLATDSDYYCSGFLKHVREIEKKTGSEKTGILSSIPKGFI